MIKKLVQGVCFLIIFGSWAIAACAQTPIDLGSVPDASVHMSTPDACDPPYEICFDYTGPDVSGTLNVFFEASPDPTTFDPSMTTYNCDTSGSSAEAAIAQGMPGLGSPHAITCGVVPSDSMESGLFEGINLDIPGAFTGETIGMTVTGGSVSFAPPPSDVSCTAGCNPDGSFTVDPVPEPATSLLYMSGLLLFFLGGFARKRLRADSVA